MSLLKNNFIDFVAIGAVIFAGCWEFEPKLEPVPHNFVNAMCTDTDDATTYSKRLDIKIACFSPIDSCVDYAKQSCPDSLKPLQVWVENE